jgi:hypothetical protein
MSGRVRLLSILAAGFTSANLGIITLMLLGLVSERLPAVWHRGMYGCFVLVPIGISCAVFLTGFALAYRRTAKESQTNGVKWFFGGLGSSAVALAIGMTAFTIAQLGLPRRWFSRGGDWNFDPMIEAIAFGLACALAGFWLVYRRAFIARSGDRACSETSET